MLLTEGWALAGGLLAGYLLGSIPTAVLVCNSMGIADPRQQGSGNPGASNATRIGGWQAGVLTLLGDVGKAWLAIYLAQAIGLRDIGLTAIALSIMVGHLFSLFNQFKGGKGVACQLGIYCALSPILAMCLVASWLAIYLWQRTPALASTVSALTAPVLAYNLAPELVTLSILLSLLVISSHYTNLKSWLAQR